MKKINRKDIIKINSSFLFEHTLNESDFKMIENYIEAIKHNHIKCKNPQVGDIVEGAYYDGMRPYSDGIINKINDDGSLNICYEPYIPFISINNGFIEISVSGGPFENHSSKELILVKEDDERIFSDWGSCGACENGRVNFIAPVRRWKIPFEWKSRTYAQIFNKPVKNDYLITIKQFGDFFNIASFKTKEQFNRYCATLGIKYTLHEEKDEYNHYTISHDFKKKYFWKLEDLPIGCKPMKMLSNGKIIDSYFRTTEKEIEIYKPNPNAKDVYKPITLEEQIAHLNKFGTY